MKIIKKDTRLQNILQAIILFGFAVYFIGVFISGSVYRYVHERQVPILLFSAAVFLVIGVLKLRRGNVLPLSFFSGRRRYSGRLSVTVFAIALVGMSASALGAAVRFSPFAYMDSIGGQAVVSSGTMPVSEAALDSSVEPSIISSAAAESPAAIVFPATESSVNGGANVRTSDDGIVLDNDTFASWLTELYTKPDVWVGKKITATGSVWKDETLFEKNEFALARMMMSCCAADMQPVGILAQWEAIPTLTDGEWIEVTGTLSKKPYKGSFDPLILVETIKKIDPPEREYIYP